MTRASLPTLAPDAPGDARRNPDDGYPLASPYPVDRRTRAAIRSVMRVLLPEGDAPRGPGLDERVLDQMLVGLMYMPAASQKGILAVFHMLEWAPVWRGHGRRPLSALSREEATRVLEGLEESKLMPIRLLMLAPKGLLLSAYYDQDEVHAAIGYAPTRFTQERIQIRQKILRGEPVTEGDLIHHAEELR